MGDHHAQSRRRRRRHLLLAIVLLAGLTAACGSSGSSTADTHAPPAQQATAPDVTASPMPSPPQPVTFHYTHQWTIYSKAPDGSTWKSVVSLGHLIAGSDLTPAVENSLGCALDDQRDAAIPVQITATNTTAGFAVEPKVVLQIVNQAFDGFSAGLTYDTLGTGEAVSWGETGTGAECSPLTGWDDTSPPPNISLDFPSANTPEGSVGLAYGTLVLSGWESPDHPNGDSSFLTNVWIEVPKIPIADDQWETEKVTGPSVYKSPPDTNYSSAGWFFPVVGFGEPDCRNPDVSGANCQAR